MKPISGAYHSSPCTSIVAGPLVRLACALPVIFRRMQPEKVPAGTITVSSVPAIALTVGNDICLPSRVLCQVEDHVVPSATGTLRT